MFGLSSRARGKHAIYPHHRKNAIRNASRCCDRNESPMVMYLKNVLSESSTWCRARVRGDVKMYKAVLGLFIVSVAMAGEQAAATPVCANGKCQNASESKPRRFFNKNANVPKTIFKPIRSGHCTTCR
jgi:hypothetical protein